MKNILPYLLLGLIMPAIILSCKKDKIEAPKLEIEKWFFEKVVFEEFNQLDSLIESETDSNWSANDYLLLQSDGIFELVQSDDKITGNYQIQNSAMTLQYLANSGLAYAIYAPIIEKSSSKFIFYEEDRNGSSRYRSTVYLKK